MPNLLPPHFPTRLDLINRISPLAPIAHLTPPQPWAPLTDAEWAHLAPFLAIHGCGLSLTPRPGRPPLDTRARLDAIFRAVSLKGPGGSRGAWSLLPAEHGKPDTVSRSFRRWAHANLWARLLATVACPTCPAPLRRLTWLICCAFRRATRIMGLRAIVLARRLGLYSSPAGALGPAARSGFVRKPAAGAARAAEFPGRPSLVAAAEGGAQGPGRPAPALCRPPAGLTLDGTGLRPAPAPACHATCCSAKCRLILPGAAPGPMRAI